MDEQPNKITILRDQQTYTIITDTGYPGHLDVADHLTYDEMLGYVSRLCVPHFSNGDPIRCWGRPLFLEPPMPKHPDAAGDAAPPPFVPQSGYDEPLPREPGEVEKPTPADALDVIF